MAKPAFGQVWRCLSSEMMLIGHMGDADNGHWRTVCLVSRLIMDWSGLADDPAKRIDGWELLSEED